MAIPVRDYLRSNTGLSATEVGSIHATVHATQDEVVLLDGEIQELDAQMMDLRQRQERLVEIRQRVSRSLAEHKALLAPIRRCPPEILAEIFVHLLPPALSPPRKSYTCPIMPGLHPLASGFSFSTTALVLHMRVSQLRHMCLTS